MNDSATDLERLRAAPAPRDEAMCRPLVGTLEPAWGFIAYGILWAFVANCLAMIPAFGYMLVVSHVTPSGRPIGGASMAGLVAVYAAGFVAAWMLFARWVARRRGGALALFRDGELTEGKLLSVSHIYVRGSEVTRGRIELTVDGTPAQAIVSVAGHLTTMGEGGVVPVLFLRGYRYCGAFVVGGKLTPASFKR